MDYTKVYEPEIRALLGTVSHFCEVLVLQSRSKTDYVNFQVMWLFQNAMYVPVGKDVTDPEIINKVPDSTPELTRGNCKSKFHEFTWELTSKGHFHCLSRRQLLQLPNPTARRRI